ncbi:helix-turn-helix domain-containing protein [Paenibacillus qinlingensis]|uniref:Transcriptional regulator n=1 Tax=Paenibacillus qinlingensis TaxID=1837343 RepID=A0ABU1P6U7_9BACL|nr:helix-turn-helix domain-containing protein [Paenibacillus qinlingensis]MDR6555489.1 putative transcriptional regulator [Paenibacillus qinlingensis]
MENKLRDTRIKRGMSISELARRSNTTRQTIYAIEKSEVKNISGYLMFALADALECNEREIFLNNM